MGKLNEDDTTSSSRIFIKILFQELAEFIGLAKLVDRTRDGSMAEAWEGLLPRDNPRDTRFAINFFTSIGLGGLTEDLRSHLKTAPKPTAVVAPIMRGGQESSESSTDSEEERRRRRKKEKKKARKEQEKRRKKREASESEDEDTHGKKKSRRKRNDSEDDEVRRDDGRRKDHMQDKSTGRVERRKETRSRRSRSPESDGESRVERRKEAS